MELISLSKKDKYDGHYVIHATKKIIGGTMRDWTGKYYFLAFEDELYDTETLRGIATEIDKLNNEKT